MARLPMPSGYTWRFVGQVDQLDQARSALLSALVISIVLIYMLLVALYESWLDPLAIMFSVPVALVGAVGGVLLTSNTFNLFSVISMIPLALKMEEGAESRAPMAVVLIGGLVTSTLLTLVLVPVMYTYLDDLGRLPALARARVPGWLRLRRQRPALPPMAGGAEPPAE